MLEPQERAELHDTFTVGRSDLTHIRTAGFRAIYSSSRTRGVDAVVTAAAAEVRRIEQVLRFRTNLQVEALGELKGSRQAGVQLP